MKSLFKPLLVIYILILLWVVLFKTSTDIASVLLDHQARSLSLVPFAGYSRGGLSEMASNVIVFIPLGLLLSVNFKHVSLWRKLFFVFLLSLTAEIVQFILAIGVTDITDIIMNTLGGLIGLVLYATSNKFIDTKNQDRFIVVTGMILLAILLFLRFFVLKVQY